MMTKRKFKIQNSRRKGAALLVVLLIVMAITILSLGFLSRSDVELACGRNMLLKTQMDYLAESGLEHAKGLILSPQDVGSAYWTGAAGQQLIAGSDDYYDVVVVRDDSDPTNRCNYFIDCKAYRLKGGQQVGRSSLKAELRLDPCIAFWSGASTTIASRVTINGDVYCDGDLSGVGDINGDAFASGNITAMSVQGRTNKYVPQAPVSFPGLTVNDFSLHYYIGSTQYSVGNIATDILDAITLGPTVGNPAGIYYRNGDLELQEDVTIHGTLVVKDRLIVTDDGNTITAHKNFPAIIIGKHLEIKGSEGAAITVKGLVQSKDGVHIQADTENALIRITGGLFTETQGIRVDKLDFGYMTITVVPDKAAIQVWPTAGTAKRWSPAGNAFFKSIERE